MSLGDRLRGKHHDLWVHRLRQTSWIFTGNKRANLRGLTCCGRLQRSVRPIQQWPGRKKTRYSFFQKLRAFAFLNNGGAPEMIASMVGGGIGQWSRSRLSSLQLNPYGAAALCAVIASGMYFPIAALSSHVGFGTVRHPAGLISSVLFLVPGFALVAALLDLLRHQTAAAVTRMSYGVMIFLAATFGLSVVVAFVKVDLTLEPALELAYPLKLVLRGIASFLGGCGFAMLYNSSGRTAFAVGLLALGANELRLA
jgi:Putative threonine/serine exporter